MKHARSYVRWEHAFAAELLAFRQRAARRRFLVATQVVICLRLAMARREPSAAQSFAADKFST